MTGKELRILRINKGLSRRGLAREIQVPEQTLRRLESGQSISLRYAKRIADHFGLAVTDVLPKLAVATRDREAAVKLRDAASRPADVAPKTEHMARWVGQPGTQHSARGDLAP